LSDFGRAKRGALFNPMLRRLLVYVAMGKCYKVTFLEWLR